MAWIEAARAVLADGDVLTLRRDGGDFEIRFNLHELMSSRNAVSETALAKIACARVDRRSARVLIGGLGMGYTLRAVLDEVGREAAVIVAELVPEVVEWNRGPLSDLAARPLDDPRATVRVGDVADVMRTSPAAFDAILMDVDNGPDAVMVAANRFLYSAGGVRLILRALRPGGVLAVWAADRSAGFERVLDGFAHERMEVNLRGGGGPVHTIYLVRAAM